MPVKGNGREAIRVLARPPNIFPSPGVSLKEPWEMAHGISLRFNNEESIMISPRSLITASGILFLLGCGGGAGIDLTTPEGQTLQAAYSGSWELLRLESENLAEKMRGAMAAPGGTQGGMTGGRGGMWGGGRGGSRSGMRGGMPSQMDPEQIMAAREGVQALSQTPERMALSLRPDRVTLSPEDQVTLPLVLGGEEERFYQANTEFSARAKWTSDGLLIERELADGFAVNDEISVDEEGRLVVVREVHLMARSVDARLVYRKTGG
jgi:hypothetical protein